MEFLGRQIELGIAVEAVRGTAESSPARWLRNVSANVIHQAQKVMDDATRGRLEVSTGSRIVQEWFEGDVSGILHADVLGYFLYNIYGAVTSSNVSGSVYSHEFLLAQNNKHPSLTLFAKDGSVLQRKFSGAMLSAFELSASIDDFVRFTASLAAREDASDSSTPSYSAEYDFIGRDITVKVAESEAALSAASALEAKNIRIRWNPGMIRDHVFGSRNPNELYNAMMGIEVEFTRNYVDSVFRDLWHSDTARYVQIALEGEADIGGGNNPGLTLLLNKAQVTGWERSGANDELVTETVTLTAYLNETDGQQSEAALTNLTAGYEAGS